MPYPFGSYQNPYYYPTNYQPYQPPMQQPTQPVQQAQPQQTVSQMTNTGRIWVNGKSEADFYPVAPNTAVDLWDRNGTTLYQKRADATGRPSIIVCDIVERSETQQDGSNSGDRKVHAYATKDELSAVVGVVKDYSEALSNIKSEIETMKSDLYGVAGRKRVVKKQDVEADE